MKFTIIFLITMLVFTTGCEYLLPGGKSYTLLSGRKVSITYEDKLEIPDSSKYALFIAYETKIPIENKETLQKEI